MKICSNYTQQNFNNSKASFGSGFTQAPIKKAEAQIVNLNSFAKDVAVNFLAKKCDDLKAIFERGKVIFEANHEERIYDILSEIKQRYEFNYERCVKEASSCD